MAKWHKAKKITDRLDELCIKTAQDLEDASDAKTADAEWHRQNKQLGAHPVGGAA